MALSDFRLMMERCSNCSYCKWIPLDKVASQRFSACCPSVEYFNFNAYSARGRFQISASLIDGTAEYTDTIMDVINGCMACGACDVSCKVCRYNLEPLEHNIELKTDTVEKGHELPQLKALVENLKAEGTMMAGRTNAGRGAWAEGLNVKDLSAEKAEVMFFNGCRYSLDKSLWETPRAAIEILSGAGVDIGIFGNEEKCCAGRAYSMGYRAEWSDAADQNLKTWREAGVKTIVTSCADCYYSLKRLYAKKGSEIKVMHTIEYIDQLINEGKIKFTKEIPMTVTYHDPCHLGRLGEEYVPWEGTERKIRGQIAIWEPRRPRYNGANGIYDAPRNVLKSIPGLKLAEMERIREYAWCCGAGGGCGEAYPKLASRTAGERVTEALSTGAEAIVTACPWCERSFTSAEGENGVKMQTIDITRLVSRAI